MINEELSKMLFYIKILPATEANIFSSECFSILKQKVGGGSQVEWDVFNEKVLFSRQ